MLIRRGREIAWPLRTYREVGGEVIMLIERGGEIGGPLSTYKGM